MKFAFIYPGQGSQSVGMGRDLVENFPVAKEILERASDTLKIDFEKLLFAENENLNQTQFTQPAIFLVSAMAHAVFTQESGIAPTLSFGHSLGEVSAVACSGGLEFEAALKLTQKRAALMAKACEGKDAGMMVVLGLEDAALELFCEQERARGKSVWCANYNVDSQLVLAGKKSDLAALEPDIKALGAKRAMLLNMSVASHCPLLESAVGEFRSALDSALNPAFGDVISNATLEIYSSKEKAVELLSAQLTHPVRYKQSVSSVDSKVDAYIELGNGSVLRGLNKKLTSKATLGVSDLASLKESLNYIKEQA